METLAYISEDDRWEPRGRCSRCCGGLPAEHSQTYRHPVTPDGDCPGHLAQDAHGRAVDLCGAFDGQLWLDEGCPSAV